MNEVHEQRRPRTFGADGRASTVVAEYHRPGVGLVAITFYDYAECGNRARLFILGREFDSTQRFLSDRAAMGWVRRWLRQQGYSVRWTRRVKGEKKA